MTEPSNTSFHVVIVGAGISGLAAAVAFQRLGIRALVLEKSSSLRTEGSSLSIWKNAWRALDVLGVGNNLREQYIMLSGTNLISAEGKLVHQIKFEDAEVRAVERHALLEALAGALPVETIRFNSKVVSIRRGKSRAAEIELEDGAVFTSKLLVGCDGVRSEVAKFLGLKEPGFVGQYVIRGVADLEHGYGTEIMQFLGKGTRGAFVPITSSKVYWFVCFKSSSAESGRVGAEELREEALERFRSCCESRTEEFSVLVKNTPNYSITRNSLRHRWSLPRVTSPPLSVDGITLAGDALHPMTPNLGQGGCLALEDAVVLARKVHRAVKKNWDQSEDDDDEELKLALEEYTRERVSRCLPLTIKSYFIGFFAMLNLGPLAFVRDKFAVKSLHPEKLFAHTRYDCGSLE